jgi:hypothetical protein
MNDHDIEDLLRRHRPAGPLPALRARILSAPIRSRRVWPWAVAAAALLAAAVSLQISAREIRTGMGPQPVQPFIDEREGALRALIGGDADFTQALEWETRLAEHAAVQGTEDVPAWR